MVELHRFSGEACLDIRVRCCWKEQPLSKRYNLSTKLHGFTSRRTSNWSEFVTSENNIHSAPHPIHPPTSTSQTTVSELFVYLYCRVKLSLLFPARSDSIISMFTRPASKALCFLRVRKDLCAQVVGFIYVQQKRPDFRS